MLDASLISDAPFVSAFVIAVLGGLLSFLSPCVLPVVPPYLAFMGGVSMTEMDGTTRGRGRVILAACFFVMGLSTIFLLLGAAASALGRAILVWQDQLIVGSGIVIMIFGAHFVGAIRIPFFDREARFEADNKGGSALGAYVLGLAFAFGWTPCLGPILGAILSLAAGAGDAGRGMLLLAGYAAGLGLPFLLVAAFFPSLRGAMGFLKRHMEQVQRISGLLLWTVGLMMATGQFSAMSYWLLEHIPALARIG